MDAEHSRGTEHSKHPAGRPGRATMASPTGHFGEQMPSSTPAQAALLRLSKALTPIPARFPWLDRDFPEGSHGDTVELRVGGEAAAALVDVLRTHPGTRTHQNEIGPLLLFLSRAAGGVCTERVANPDRADYCLEPSWETTGRCLQHVWPHPEGIDTQPHLCHWAYPAAKQQAPTAPVFRCTGTSRHSSGLCPAHERTLASTCYRPTSKRTTCLETIRDADGEGCRHHRGRPRVAVTSAWSGPVLTTVHTTGG